MMKQFYQLVSRLFERTSLRNENRHLPSGDPLIRISTSQSTTPTSSKRLDRLISSYNIDKIEKIDEVHGVSILIIRGTPWACSKVLADELEVYINEKKRSEKGTQEND